MTKKVRARMAVEEVKLLREALGLTQVQFAELLGIGDNTPSRWETGKHPISRNLCLMMLLLRDVPGVHEYLAALAPKAGRWRGAA